MIVVYTSSHNVDQYLPTAINSLLTHNPNAFIYIISDKESIPCIKQGKNIKIISAQNIPDFLENDNKNIRNYSKMVLSRCWLSKILSEDKVLYLDIDTIVLDDLSDLWNMDISEYAVAGWPEDRKKVAEKFMIPRQRMIYNKYINSGVMLLNLKFIREHHIDDAQIELLRTESFPLPDQDVINITCDGYIKYLDAIYNFGPLNEQYIPNINKVKIYHMTTKKFWGNKNKNYKYYYLWERYYVNNLFNNKLKIKYIETHLCEHCNLNCRGCAHFSPLAAPEFKDYNEFKKDMEQLALLTNNDIPTIRLMGGEPLLNKDFVKYCLVTRELFPNSDIVLVTNGTLLKDIVDSDIDLLNKANISIYVSNYHIPIDTNKFMRFNKRTMDDRSQMTNISLDLSGSQDIQHAYDNCDMVKYGCCLFLQHGRIFACPVGANIEHFCKYFNVQIDYDIDDISIDIYNHSAREIEKFIHTPHQMCKYCNSDKRWASYQPFAITKKDINEWICQ